MADYVVITSKIAKAWGGCPSNNYTNYDDNYCPTKKEIISKFGCLIRNEAKAEISPNSPTWKDNELVATYDVYRTRITCTCNNCYDGVVNPKPCTSNNCSIYNKKCPGCHEGNVGITCNTNCAIQSTTCTGCNKGNTGESCSTNCTIYNGYCTGCHEGYGNSKQCDINGCDVVNECICNGCNKGVIKDCDTNCNSAHESTLSGPCTCNGGVTNPCSANGCNSGYNTWCTGCNKGVTNPKPCSANGCTSYNTSCTGCHEGQSPNFECGDIEEINN